MLSRLRALDDRVLGDRLKGSPVTDTATETTGDPRGGSSRRPPRAVVDDVLKVVWRVSQVVFVVLAVIVVLGIVFTLTPANPDNVIVRNALSIAEGAAGPFKDVFTVEDDPDRMIAVNYAVGAAVFLLLAVVVGKLPGAKK